MSCIIEFIKRFWEIGYHTIHAGDFIFFVHKDFNKFNYTGALMLDFYLSYNIIIIFNHIFGVKTSRFCHIARKVVMDVAKYENKYGFMDFNNRRFITTRRNAI